MKRSELRSLIGEVLVEFKGGWFDDLSKTAQEKYVDEHPESDYAKDAGKKDTEEKDDTKLYHFVNKVSGTTLDIRLTPEKAQKKLGQLNQDSDKWKVKSVEEMIRELVRSLIQEELLFEKTVVDVIDQHNTLASQLTKLMTDWKKNWSKIKSTDKAESYKSNYIKKVKPLQDKLKAIEKSYNKAMDKLLSPKNAEELAAWN